MDYLFIFSILRDAVIVVVDVHMHIDSILQYTIQYVDNSTVGTVSCNRE